MKKPKVVVIMPAYKAEKTLKKTYDDIPKNIVDEIILVDDNSPDRTVEIAKELKIDKVIKHKRNLGYGANQKTCYTTALKEGADIVIMIHPDYQYDPKVLPPMVEILKNKQADVVYGSRMLTSGGAKKGGMSLYKRIGNKVLTKTINWVTGVKLTDAATGYIAYSRKVLQTIPYLLNSDRFTFDEEAIIECAGYGFKLVEVPVPTKYENESSSISFRKSVIYGISLYITLLKYILHRNGVYTSSLFRTIPRKWEKEQRDELVEVVYSKK